MAKKPAGVRYRIIFDDIVRTKKGVLLACFANADGQRVKVALTEDQTRTFLDGSEPMPYPFSDDQLIRALGGFRQKRGKPRP